MTDHPSPDALADLDSGLPVDAQVSSHVDGCVSCAADLAQIRSVSRLLADLPTEPLPADIADRIDTALRAERALISAPATVVPLPSRTRRAVPGWVAAAAAGVALFGGAAFMLNNLNGRSDGGSGSGVTASRTSDKNVIRSTGSDYRAVSLADQLPTLLGTAAADLGTMSGGGSTSGAPPTAPGTEAMPGATASKSSDQSLAAAQARQATQAQQLAALADPAALAVCLVRALGADMDDPIAVDLARYNGEPAVVVAVPALGRTDKVDIYVLDPGCPEGAFVYFARLPLPQPR